MSARGFRLHWDAEHGWLLDVPVTLGREQLRRIAAWALPKQIDRYRSLPPGDRKDDLGRAIERLGRSEIRQRLVDHDGDGVAIPFASTERVNPERRIFA
ncbi:MAG TPA: hypothetical protein VGV13_13315 [Methylomirabilota bacterium]|jgi:hypothetical protein|nr:hypothetical protein [Methylomirabilota bacterium]